MSNKGQGHFTSAKNHLDFKRKAYVSQKVLGPLKLNFNSLMEHENENVYK